MAGLLLAASLAVSAQAGGNASTPVPQASQSAKAPSDASSAGPTSAERAFKFEDVVRKVEKEGAETSIRNYIAEDFGLRYGSVDNPAPTSLASAHALAVDDPQRVLYVFDETGAVMFTVQVGDGRVTYLASHAGVLKQAGRYTQGRLGSENLARIPNQKAAAGFAAEKEYWIKRVFYPDTLETAVTGQASSQPQSARRAAKAKAAPASKTTADAAENEKLSQMTPRERVKYLDKLKREAEREAKAEKKESAKEKKVTSQQAADDSDSAPEKKKRSWF